MAPPADARQLARRVHHRARHVPPGRAHTRNAPDASRGVSCVVLVPAIKRSASRERSVGNRGRRSCGTAHSRRCRPPRCVGQRDLRHLEQRVQGPRRHNSKAAVVIARPNRIRDTNIRLSATCEVTTIGRSARVPTKSLLTVRPGRSAWRLTPQRGTLSIVGAQEGPSSSTRPGPARVTPTDPQPQVLTNIRQGDLLAHRAAFWGLFGAPEVHP